MYLVFFMIVFSRYIFYDKDGNSNIVFNKKLINFYYVIITLYMVLLLTIRHDYVGTDTQNYRLIFNYVRDTDIRSALFFTNPGYVLLNKFLAIINANFRVLLFIQAVIYIGSTSYLIKKYSNMPALSYFIFMTFGYFIFATTKRQAIAMSLTMIAFEQIKKKNFKLYILFILFAITFHISALIFIPAYWINRFAFNNKTIFLIAIVTIIIFIFRKRLGLFVLSLNRNEYEIMQTGGYLLLLFYFAFFVLGLIYKKNFIINNPNNKILLYFLAATIALIPVSKIHPAFFRITNYYAIFIILYIPNLITCIKDKTAKSIIFIGIIALGLYYFYYKIPSYGIHMHPYIFYWEKYPL